jgi:hypothetical protein
VLRSTSIYIKTDTCALATLGYRVAILDKGNGGSDGRWIKEYADANANANTKMQDAGCGMWDAGCRMQDTGHGMQNARCRCKGYLKDV